MMRKLMISLPLFVTLAAAASIITTPLLPTATYGQAPTIQDEAERLLSQQPPAAPGGLLPSLQNMEVPCTDAANSTVVTCLTFSDLTGTNPTYQHFTPEVIQFQQTDPTFARYVQLVRDCTNLTNQIFTRPPGVTAGQDMVDDDQIQTCNTMINQAIDQFCSFTAMDIAKCNAAKEVTNLYQIMSLAALGV